MGGVIIVLLLGAAAGYAYHESQTVRGAVSKGKKIVGKATEGARLPRPDFRVHLPNSPDDYDTLDEVICECATTVKADEPDIELGALMNAVRDCTLGVLYPDFQWPPIPGDHPTVEQLWIIVSYEVSRSANEGTLCATLQPEEDVEENPLQTRFIPPPR